MFKPLYALFLTIPYLTSLIFLLVSQITQKNDEIKHLQHSLKVNSGEELDVSLLAKKQFQSHDNLSKIKQNSIQQEIDQLNSQLNNSVLENRKVEKELQEVRSGFLHQPFLK